MRRGAPHGKRPEDCTPLFAAYVRLRTMTDYVNTPAGTEIDRSPAV